MKKHTLLKNAGFSGRQHFYEITGINANYQHRLNAQDPDFFAWLVDQYKPLAKCKPRIRQCLEIIVLFDDIAKIKVSCQRGNYIAALNKAHADHEQIKQIIIDDIPDGAAFDELIEIQASSHVDAMDDLPK